MGEAKRKKDLSQILVGVDDGYARVKVYGVDGARSLQVSAAATVQSGTLMSTLDGAATGGGVYETDGLRFTVCEEMGGEETRFDGYHTSALNRVAVHNALHAAGLSGREVNLVVGLPVRDFFSDGGLNKVLIGAKKDSMAKPVTRIGGASIEVKKVQVLPQAIAALIDWAKSDPQRAAKANSLNEVAVIDIGGRTTDVAVVIKGARVDLGRSGSNNLGVLDVLEAIEDGLRHKFSLSEQIPRNLTEGALRTGKITLFRKEHDVSDLVLKARRQVADQLSRTIRKFLGTGALLEAVLFVGGGAKVFGDVVAEFEGGVVPGEPEFSNARGMWRMAANG